MKRLVVLGLMTGFATGAVQAEDRYQLLERGDSLVRMDRVTGQVSTCRKVGVSLACSIAADEREALLSANEDLSTRIDALEKRVRLLETPDISTQSDENAPEDIPGFDKAMEVTERVMRRMIAMMKELKQDFESN